MLSCFWFLTHMYARSGVAGAWPGSGRDSGCSSWPGFPFCRSDQGLYTPTRLSARQISSAHVMLLPTPVSLGPRSTGNRLEPLLSGHFSDTAPHVCPFFARLRCTRLRVSLPAPAAPRSSATCRRTAAGSDALPPAGASSTWHASPAGLRFSPAAAGDS